MRFFIPIRLILSIGLIFVLNNILANKVPGYIISNKTDTIFGEIKVSRFDLYTGGFVINGINLEPFHSMVRFKEIGQGRFRTYEPEYLIGFGFLDNTINYRFKRFKIESKSIVKTGRERFRFLSLIYLGEIAIYRDIIRRPNNMETSVINQNDNTIVFYDYYLYTEKHGLKKVVWSKDYRTLIELLTYYEIDSEFIEQIAPNARFKDVREIFQEYEKWKTKKSSKIFKT